MLNDLRFAFRMLFKNPGFTAVAILTLALGIGGTTAIFSVIHCAVLDPFPYANSHRLAVLVTHDKMQGQYVGWAWVSAPEFLDYQEQNHVFDEIIGRSARSVLLTGTGAPELFQGLYVTSNTFRVLGVHPLIGRSIDPEDCKPGAPPVVVLPYELWRKKFASDPGIIGRMLVLNHQPTTVIGVMPPHFHWTGSDESQLCLPATLSPDQSQYFTIVGHLKPGVTLEQAAADVGALSKRLASVYVKDHPPEVTVGVESLVNASVGSFRKTLYILLGAVGLLLLIACANVANLLLARATAREKEFAVRASLGASRGRLVRQLLVESLLLALGGAVLGCLLAWNALAGLVAIIPPGMIPSEAVVRINSPALLFSLGTTLISTLLFGLAPAVHAVRKDLREPLKASSKGGGESHRQNTVRNLLVVSEVTLSLVLLTGASLLIRSFLALQHIELGCNLDHVLGTFLMLPEERYKTAEQRNQFHLELLRQVRALPGVVSAGLGNPWARELMTIELARKPSAENRRAWCSLLSDRVFEILEIPLDRGRAISEEDFVHASLDFHGKPFA